MKLVASYGLSDKYFDKGPVSPERLQALLKNKVELIDDVSTYGSLDYREERKAEGIVSMLHLPISAWWMPWLPKSLFPVSQNQCHL